MWLAVGGLDDAEGRGTLFHVFSGASSGMALRCLYGRCCGLIPFFGPIYIRDARCEVGR
jgi:hypothetical protein